MFPDDYKRVQQAGGSAAEVLVHVGLPRQIIIDTTNKEIRLLDGSTPGGKAAIMEDRLLDYFQELPGGAFADAGGVLPDGETPSALPAGWSPAIMRQLFSMGFTFLDAAWLIKNGALPSPIREYTTEQNDPNLAVKTGFYMINPSFSVNMPGDAPLASTVRMMLQVIAQSAQNFIQILYARDGSDKVWRRNCQSGNFEDWILGEGITSADLAGLLPLVGGLMTGKLRTAASNNTRAGLNIPTGSPPAIPADGDLWLAGIDIAYRIAGVTRQIFHSGKIATPAELQSGAADRVVGPANLKTALPELMHGKWLNVGASRAPDVVYQNLTGRHLLVVIGSSNNSVIFEYSVDASNWLHLAGQSDLYRIFFSVPPGGYYKCAYSTVGEIWYESVGAY